MRLGFGCVNLGAARLGSANAQVRLVHEAIDAGVTLFDTADAYGHGSSERLLGRALRGHRSQVTVATKAGYLFDDRPRSIRVARTAASRVLAAVRPEPVRSGDCYAAQDFSPPVLRLAVDASLRRLGTDHIDVLQLHGPHEHLPHLFGELADLVAVGKVGRFGVGAESIAEAHEWLGTPGLEVLQVPFGLLDPVGATVLAGLHGIEGWVRGVFGGGVLTRAGATHGAAHPKEVVVEELRRTAASAGVDLFALAMGFVKAEPHIDTVLVGMSTPAHLRRNVELFDSMALDGETLRSVRDVLARHAAVLEAS